MSRHERFPRSQDAVPRDRELDTEDFLDERESEADLDSASESLSPAEIEYMEQRAEWREAKQSYQEAKHTYETRLAEYYDQYSEKNLAGRAAHKLGEWWNGKPADLEALETDFKAARATYAAGLESVLSVRGQAHEQNREFDATDTQTRTAFAERFIRRPRQDQLQIEKEHLHSAETTERAEHVLHVLQKHKWTTRIGVVAATGLVVGSGAGVAAGIAAGGIKAGRVALGVTGGMAGAAAGNWLGSERVAQTETQLAEVQADTLASFTVSDIDTLERALTDAENTHDAALRARKHKMIAGAIIGGGSLANIDSLADMVVSPAEAATNPHATSFEDTPAKSVEDTTLDQDVIDDILQEAEENSPYREPWGEGLVDAADSDTPAPTPETPPSPDETTDAEALAEDARAALRETEQAIVAEELAADTREALQKTSRVTEAEELATDTREALRDTAGPQEAVVTETSASYTAAEELAADTREALRETLPISEYNIEQGDNLWNITEEVYAQQLEGLTESEQNRVLDAVFDRLRADAELTTDLGVKSGNIDLIYQDDVLKMSVLSDLIAEEVEQFNTPTPEGIVTVKSGDNLWNLTADAYSDKLEGLTETQQNHVLDAVFDRLRADPALTTELGVQSGNIDLIRPEEQLDLEKLSTLMQEEVARFGGKDITGEEVIDTPPYTTEPATPNDAGQAETPPSPEETASAEELAEDTREALRETEQAIAAEELAADTRDVLRNTADQPEAVGVNTPAAERPETAIPPDTEVQATVDPHPETVTANAENTPAVDPLYAQAEAAPAADTTPETVLTPTPPEVLAASEALQLSPEISLRILQTFGSVEQFEQAKFETIKSMFDSELAQQYENLGKEPVYEKLKQLDMQVLKLNNLDAVDRLNDPAVSILSEQLRIEESPMNATALRTWHELYLSQLRPKHPDYLDIPITKGMTFDEFFSEYVTRSHTQ